MHHPLTTILAALLMACTTATATETFYLGADISGTTALEAHGDTLYNAAGQPRENTILMKELGMNAIRLRVWVDPTDGFCSPQDVLMMARRARDIGLPVMIDFHYSDWWADPGKQNIPHQWAQMDYPQMCRALADHTRSTLRLLRDNNIDVRWVQVGNETTDGFLWPMGRATTNMEQYAGLTCAGYDAVKEVFPDAAVIIHLDAGCDPKRYDFIFDGLRRYGTPWDIIGMSVYPYWDLDAHLQTDYHGTIDGFTANIKRLANKYGCELMVVETGVEAKKPYIGKQIMSEIIDAARNRCDGHCLGVFYWAPELEGPYPLGAFENHRPTVIMDAFTEAARTLAPQADVTADEALEQVRRVYADVANTYRNDVPPNCLAKNLDNAYCSQNWLQTVESVIKKDSSLDGEMGFFVADYWVMGQDYNNVYADNFRLDAFNAHAMPPTATVSLDLHNCGNVTRVSVDLVYEDGQWRIDNFTDVTLQLNWKQAMNEYLAE